MRQVAISVLVASAVFFALTAGIDILFHSAPLNAETAMTSAFRTVVFAMAFAAIKVATLMFKGTKE